MGDFEHAGSPRLVREVLTGIAQKQWPAGAVAKCKICPKANEVTMERIVEYMQNGFPIHCGLEITLTEKR